jgi:lantibiotic transport system permease protein
VAQHSLASSAGWTFYAAKLTLVIALDGMILPHLQREVVFAPPIPWGMILRNCAQVFGLGFAGLAIQNWISLRWQSFSVAIAAGIVLLVLGVFAGAVGQATDTSLRFFPSSLPMLILAQNAVNVAFGLRISVACGVLVAVAAGIDFCRREVS